MPQARWAHACLCGGLIQCRLPAHYRRVLSEAGSTPPGPRSPAPQRSDCLSLSSDLLKIPIARACSGTTPPLREEPYASFFVGTVKHFKPISCRGVVKCAAATGDLGMGRISLRWISILRRRAPGQLSITSRRASHDTFDVEVFWFHNVWLILGFCERREKFKDCGTLRVGAHVHPLI